MVTIALPNNVIIYIQKVTRRLALKLFWEVR